MQAKRVRALLQRRFSDGLELPWQVPVKQVDGSVLGVCSPCCWLRRQRVFALLGPQIALIC
jgi:hypothetical protein